MREINPSRLKRVADLGVGDVVGEARPWYVVVHAPRQVGNEWVATVRYPDADGGLEKGPLTERSWRDADNVYLPVIPRSAKQMEIGGGS